MTYRVVLRKEAQDDLDGAARWYEAQRPNLGNEFLDEAVSAFERIGGSPLSYPDAYRGLRRALLRRFPFAVYYRVEPQIVSVIAVMHSARSPNRWQARS